MTYFGDLLDKSVTFDEIISFFGVNISYKSILINYNEIEFNSTMNCQILTMLKLVRLSFVLDSCFELKFKHNKKLYSIFQKPYCLRNTDMCVTT